MAQLRDTVVSGSLRATDTIYSTTNQFQILKIPTSSNGTTYGVGSNGQVLKSNGTSVYWASDNNTTSLTSMTGTLGVDHGGTGATTAAAARTNLGLGSVSNNTALNSSTGTKGDIIYWSAANTPARLGANTTTTPKYLCMTSSAPVWQEIIPTSNLDLTAITTAEIDAIITGNSSGTLTVPTKTSQLTNDSNFLVNTNNMINLNSYGAAIGMTSTSTSSAKKFEVNSNYTSYLNGSVNVAGVATFSGGITGVTNYTTGEVLTGGTWIDGKPLYRRTYVFNAAGTISLSDLNYDFIHIIDMVANTKYSNANDIWTGTYYWGSTADRLHIYIDQDGLKLRFGTSVTLYRGAWVTVEYTKATT